MVIIDYLGLIGTVERAGLYGAMRCLIEKMFFYRLDAALVVSCAGDVSGPTGSQGRGREAL